MKHTHEAKVFVEENGYASAFERTTAKITDIPPQEVLHSSDDGYTPQDTSEKNPEDFATIEEVSIHKFMSKILPGCSSVEALLENRHEDYMMTLTTSKDLNSKQIFKWNNPFSWTFTGNIAGKSRIKNTVEELGGRVDGLLRFSIMWAKEDLEDDSDLDAHCQEIPGEHIYYSHMLSGVTGGNLDVDIIHPVHHRNSTGKDVVENITYPRYPGSDMKMKFYVKNFLDRGNKTGFEAEIEFDGVIYSYNYPEGLAHKEDVYVATVSFDAMTRDWSIEHHLQPTNQEGSVIKIFGLETNHFQKVNLITASPNHWGNNAFGNKYFFFFLEGAKGTNIIKGFHRENLMGDLMVKRKIMADLEKSTMVESSSSELSGLGFNSSMRDNIILRLKGSQENRIIRVLF